MKEKIKKLSSEEFKILVGFLRYTYQQICFNKIGHEKISGQPWKNFKYIWTSILVSLRHYYLINLAKIFDKESYIVKGEEKVNLSIFRAIPEDKFNKDYWETITNIKRIRNKMLAHLDSEAVLQGRGREEDYGLDFKGRKIESLIGKTFELLNQAGESFGCTDELNQEREKRYVQDKFNEWYKVFNKNN